MRLARGGRVEARAHEPRQAASAVRRRRCVRSRRLTAEPAYKSACLETLAPGDVVKMPSKASSSAFGRRKRAAAYMSTGIFAGQHSNRI